MGDLTHSVYRLPPQEELLERFLANDCTPEEAQYVRAWAGTTHDGDPLAEVVRNAIQERWVELRDPKETRDVLWAQLRLGVPPGAPASDTSSDTSSVQTARRRGKSRVTFPVIAHRTVRRIAYGLVGFVVVIAAVLLIRTTATRVHFQTQSYTTEAGQIAQIQIASGGRVILAPESKLTVIKNSATGARIVKLLGEARFEIVHNAHAPFAVQTGRVITRVLGTTFDVRRYGGDRTGRIVVLSGKVSTTAMGYGTPLTLTAGMAAQFTDSVITAKNIIDNSTYIDWAQGQLVFHDAPIPVMLNVLSRWYAYKFQVADSTLNQQHVTATFTFGESGEMLSLLKRVLGVRMTIQDSVVILHHAQMREKHPFERNNMRTRFPLSTELGR